jgi:hypothetical protein
MAATTTTLAVTVAHAVAYLTRPLLLRSSNETILKLQLALEASLTALYAASWNPAEPLRGSGRRCMTLSPAASPPRAIYAACRAADVEWADWIAALGGIEFDLFVDPGCVSVRSGRWGAAPFGKLVTVWSQELEAFSRQQQLQQRAQVAQPKVARTPISPAFVETLQQKDEDDEEELFAILADELAAPSYKTPKCSQFFSTAMRAPARSIVSSTTRSSSPSSASSSDDDFDYAFFDDDSDAASSVTTVSSAATETSKLSRRERARLARVIVDKSKKEVTNYDNGKTTVLTGGVLLGAPAAPKAAPVKLVAQSKVFVPRFTAQSKIFVPRLSAVPRLSTAPKASPCTRQPYGPTPGLTWRIRA